MANIAKILQAVHTLSEERKSYLKQRFEEGTLTQEEQNELKEHVLQTMGYVALEMDHAQDILKRHSSNR